MKKAGPIAEHAAPGTTSWPPVRLRYVGRLKGGAGFPDAEQGLKGEELPFFKVKHLAEAEADGCLRVSEHTVSRDTASQLGAFVFPAGTIVFAKVGAALLLNRFRFVGQASCIDNNMMGLVLDDNRADQRFMLHSLALIDFGQIANPGAVPSLNAEQVAEQTVLLPPIPIQQGVAIYLDRETARLDALVAAKKRVLELLAEKRRAVITHAVTKGIDSRAPLSESGIPWLGEIPAHWQTRRLKFLTPQITVGIVVTPAKYYEASGVPCLRSLNVRESGLTDSDLVYISDESNLLHSKSRIFKGDLVAVRSGQPGTTAVVDERFDGANCIDLIIIRRSTTFDPAFMSYFLNSEPAKMQFFSGSGGAIQQHFNIETAADLVVLVPPLNEQRDVVTYIRSETTKLDELKTATERTIDLLSERRLALITAAVTGQLEVA